MSALLPNDGEYEIKVVKVPKKTSAWDRAIAFQRERDERKTVVRQAIEAQSRRARQVEADEYTAFLKRNVQQLHPETAKTISWLERMNADILKNLRTPLTWARYTYPDDPFGDMWESMPWI